MKTITKVTAALIGLSALGSAHAINVLQVGAPAGTGDTGIYADYKPILTDPTEADTAVTYGSTIYVAGVYNNNVLNLGGQFGMGGDWSSIVNNPPSGTFPAVFDGKGAILVVSVPDGSLLDALGLTINASSSFYSSSTLSNLFPNNHDPLKDSVADFLFFDIGDFAKNLNAVPNLVDETGSADGEIKSLTLGGTGNLDWIHFDAMAIETSDQGRQIRTTWESNPASHDLTWKTSGGPPTSGPVPEPGTITLLGLGLLGAFFYRRRIHQAAA